MQLHFKKTGEGKPFIILHGLFGSGDNWMSFARMLAEKEYAVYQVDLRNHGHSPHGSLHNKKVMSEDVLELIQANNLNDVLVMGHSMGGKVAMQLAIDHAEVLSSLIVVDIMPHGPGITKAFQVRPDPSGHPRRSQGTICRAWL